MKTNKAQTYYFVNIKKKKKAFVSPNGPTIDALLLHRPSTVCIPFHLHLDFLELKERGSIWSGRAQLKITTNVWAALIEWTKTSATIGLAFAKINGVGQFSLGSSMFRFKTPGCFNEKLDWNRFLNFNSAATSPSIVVMP